MNCYFLYNVSLFAWLLIYCTLADHSREDFAIYQLVTLGELFNLSVLPFLICKIGIITASTSWVIMRIKRVTTSEVLRAVPGTLRTIQVSVSRETYPSLTA